jgi:hypothetical protein
LTINNYLPPKIYLFLLTYAQKHKLALKEVELIFLRKSLSQYGFICNHESIGFAVKTKKPYCKDCYTRLELKQETSLNFKIHKTIRQTTYHDIETFLDSIELEKRTEDII